MVIPMFTPSTYLLSLKLYTDMVECKSPSKSITLSDDEELDSVLETSLDLDAETKCPKINNLESHDKVDLMYDPTRFEDVQKKSRCGKFEEHFPSKDARTDTSQPQVIEGVQMLASITLPNKDFGNVNMVQARDEDFRKRLLLNARNPISPHISPQSSIDGSLNEDVFVNLKLKAVCKLGMKRNITVYENENPKFSLVQKKYLGRYNLREVEVLKAMKHRSIPTFYGSEIQKGNTISGIWMEYCGEPLSQFVGNIYKKGSFVPESLMWNVLEQLMDVLTYLAQAKIEKQNISAMTICIQSCKRKGLLLKLVGFGEVLTYQDWPDERSRPSSQTDMVACGKVVVFMIYGPGIEKALADDMKSLIDGVRKNFPQTYSAELKAFVLKMIDGNPVTRFEPTTALTEIHKKLQQELIDVSDSDEEVFQSEEVVVPLPDSQSPLPQSPLLQFNTGDPLLLTKPQVYPNTAASFDVDPQDKKPIHSSAGVMGTFGFSSNCPEDAIAVNPGTSSYREPDKVETIPQEKKNQADSDTLHKVRSHVTLKKNNRKTPYYPSRKEYKNMPYFDKIK